MQNQGKCWRMNARRLFAVAIFVVSTQGRTADAPPDGSEELQRQQQRERALRQQLETAPDVRLERAGAPETGASISGEINLSI
ncbi:MAG TPA: hypothetical protein VJ572_00580 [Azonexus sp.]|nr:hypothetical protein [Azonexus sp.]